MANDDIATRAPESDAQEVPVAATEQSAPVSAAEHSVFPGDTVAQEGPSMGVSCSQKLAMQSNSHTDQPGTLHVRPTNSLWRDPHR